MYFDLNEKRLYIYNRVSKSTGNTISLGELLRVENAIKYWYEKEFIEYFK